jgi:FdhD protein
VRQSNGIELRIWLAHGRGRELVDRRRHLADPTGCGLCGIESLDAAAQTCPRVSGDLSVSPDDIAAAVATLSPAQILHQRTRAVRVVAAHVLCKRNKTLQLRPETCPVLDKLIGGLRRTQNHLGAHRVYTKLNPKFRSRSFAIPIPPSWPSSHS